MDKLFKLSLRGTDKKTEIIAGLTTFMTMAYVLAVQPAAICGGEAYITDVNGVVITKSAIMITCALVSGLITLLMAFYTNFPFALSTGLGSNFILGALTGNTTITTFVESTSGVEAGGRTGLTALVTGIMFLLTIFLAPLFVAIPYAATGPALIYVGFLMLKGFTEIDFTDFDEAIGPCVMMMFTAFTGNITNGLGAGIIVHVLVKLVRGKAKEIHPIMYLLCALMVLYFIVG